MERVTTAVPSVNYTNMKSTLYSNGVFMVDDLSFGTYVMCSNSSVAGENINCENRNYGARDIRIMSVLSVYYTAYPDVHPPMTPSMVYTEPPAEKKTLTTGQIVGIAVGCAAFVLLLIAAIILIVCCCCNGSRDN
ncbi:hypothetical protein AGDE_00251, partial [Angomonas deanei]